MPNFNSAFGVLNPKICDNGTSVVKISDYIESECYNEIVGCEPDAPVEIWKKTANTGKVLAFVVANMTKPIIFTAVIRCDEPDIMCLIDIRFFGEIHAVCMHGGYQF